METVPETFVGKIEGDNIFMETKVTREQKCRDLARWGGIEWHEVKANTVIGSRCSCGIICGNIAEHIKESNPDFPTAESVLKVVMGLPDKWDFVRYICQQLKQTEVWKHSVVGAFIYFMMEPDALLNAAWEWRKERENAKDKTLYNTKL